MDHREQEEQEEVREEEERLYLGSARDRSRAAAPGGPPPPPPQTAGSSSSARPAQQRMNEAARGGQDAVRGVSRDRRELRDHPASLRIFNTRNLNIIKSEIKSETFYNLSDKLLESFWNSCNKDARRQISVFLFKEAQNLLQTRSKQ